MAAAEENWISDGEFIGVLFAAALGIGAAITPSDDLIDVRRVGT